MAMTATASKKLRRKVSDAIGLINPLYLPFLFAKKHSLWCWYFFIPKWILWPYFSRTKRKINIISRIIIYCQRYEDCSDLYYFFKLGFGDKFTYPIDEPAELSKYRLVEMFTSITDHEVKLQIIESFSNVSLPLRIVCTTITFGTGVDTPNVCRIIHLRASNDVHSYIQETGGGGQDGRFTISTYWQLPSPWFGN